MSEGPESGRAKKSGRPARNPNDPPLPKSWKTTERLAACLAYLEASQDGATNALESKCAEAYPNQMDYVHQEVRSFETSYHKWEKGKKYAFTLEESKRRRPESNAICNIFLETRKHATNLIGPAYTALLNQDGKVPSGTERDALIEQLKHNLCGTDTDPEADREDGGDSRGDMPPGGVAAGGESTARGPGAGVEPPKPIPNEHSSFLTWLHLGPLCKQNRHFMPPAPKGSGKESEIPKPVELPSDHFELPGESQTQSEQSQ